MSAPRVSVLIFTRDRSDLIGETLASLERQTLEDKEIWVLDDSLDDRTELAVREHPSVRYARQTPQLEFYAAARAVLELAESEVVAYIGDDDIVSPDYLARLVVALESRPDVSAAYARSVRVNEAGRPLFGSKDLPELHGGGPFGFLAHLNQKPDDRLARMWGVIRKDVMREALELPYLTDTGRPALGRDFMMFFHLCMRGKIYYCRDAEYRFLVHQRQTGQSAPGRFGVLPKWRFSMADQAVGYAWLVESILSLVEAGTYGGVDPILGVGFSYELWRWYAKAMAGLQQLNLLEHAKGFERAGQPDLSVSLREGLAHGAVSAPPMSFHIPGERAG